METIILESDAEKKADLSAKWKEEILKYFAEELHFADKNQVDKKMKSVLIAERAF